MRWTRSYISGDAEQERSGTPTSLVDLPESLLEVIRLGPFLTALLLVLSIPGDLAAQEAQSGQLSGTVVDLDTGAPVAEALVVLEEGVRGGDGDVDLRSVTDAGGDFLLVPVTSGRHVLRVEHLSYGVHRQSLQVEGEGIGSVEISLSRTTIRLEPLVVESTASADLAARASPSSRNVITRDAIAASASTGLALGDFLDREVSGVYLRRDSGIGGRVCVEFRGARRADGICRPPQVHLDGTNVPDPLGLFGSLSLEGLQQIRVIPPAEAGVRFGSNAGWGVILLETRRARPPSGPAIPLVERAPRGTTMVDWSVEPEPYPWAKVYGAALLGNVVGLAAGSAVLSRCMDLETLRFYRGDDYCGAPALLGSGIALTILPALSGALGARLAGSTPRSRGNLGRSILYSIPVFVPGFAIAGLNAGERGIGGVEIVGLTLMVLGAPALNTLSDYLFRTLR